MIHTSCFISMCFITHSLSQFSHPNWSSLTMILSTWQTVWQQLALRSLLFSIITSLSLESFSISAFTQILSLVFSGPAAKGNDVWNQRIYLPWWREWGEFDPSLSGISFSHPSLNLTSPILSSIVRISMTQSLVVDMGTKLKDMARTCSTLPASMTSTGEWSGREVFWPGNTLTRTDG